VGAVLAFDALAADETTRCALRSNAINEAESFDSIKNVAISLIEHLTLRPLCTRVEIAPKNDLLVVPRIIKHRTQFGKRPVNGRV